MKIIVSEGFVKDLASGIMKLSTMAIKTAFWLTKKGYDIAASVGSNKGNNPFAALFGSKYALNKMIIEAFASSFSGDFATYFRAYLTKMSAKIDFAKIVTDYKKPLPPELQSADPENKELQRKKEIVLYDRKIIAFPLIITPMYNFFMKKLFEEGLFFKNFTTGNRKVDAAMAEALSLVLLSDESMQFLAKMQNDGDTFAEVLDRIFKVVKEEIVKVNSGAQPSPTSNSNLSEGWQDFFGINKKKNVYELASEIVKKLKFDKDIEIKVIEAFQGLGYENVGRTMDGQTKPLAMSIFEGSKIKMLNTFAKITKNCGNNFEKFNIFINKLFQDDRFLNEFGKEFNERLVKSGINGINFMKGRSSQIYKMANTEREFEDNKNIFTSANDTKKEQDKDTQNGDSEL